MTKTNFIKLIMATTIAALFAIIVYTAFAYTAFYLRDKTHNYTQTKYVYYFPVSKVIDGDTIIIQDRWAKFPSLVWKIRIRGLDTGEAGGRAECPHEAEMADKARKYATLLITESDYKVKIINPRHDKYGGRIVADLGLRDGTNFADRMIEANLAHEYYGGTRESWCEAA